jgi:hypothetical protein
MNTDIRLFHGTSKKHLDSILRRGLQPRGTNPSNWEDFPSAPDRVYLTRSYAIFFAIKSAYLTNTDPVIIEVDVQDNLVADEDYLAQCKWKDKELNFLQDKTLEDKTLYWKIRSPAYPMMAEHSLNKLGNCCHMGTIKPKQIKSWMSFRKDNEIALSHDPTITIQNFFLLGQGYINSLQKFFDSYGKQGKMWEEFDKLIELNNA